MSSEQILSAFVPSIKISMYGTLTTFAIWVTTNQGILVFISFVTTTIVSTYSIFRTRAKMKMDIKEHEKQMAIYNEMLKDEEKKLSVAKDRKENFGC